MQQFTRRHLMFSIATATAGWCQRPQEQPAKATLNLTDFEPKSMLVVPETKVDKAKFPGIDVHTHVYSHRGGGSRQQIPTKQVEEIVQWMDGLNMQMLINSTGGYGDNLKRTIDELVNRHPGRFLTMTEPAWDRIREPGYATWQAEEIRRARKAGAVGIKVLKSLGLNLREQGSSGPLLKVDDTRFDPMWEAAGELDMPVAIHTSDPDAFFTPIDRFNERWEELGNHPDWSFYGKDYPPKPELLAARNRVIAKHPKTKFIAYHVANHPENLSEVASWLDRYPNMYVETGARLGELGRQPVSARKFFLKYADRILFGTDATPNGFNYPQQNLTPAMYRCYFRFFETLDEYFDYSPAATPPQGRWRIYGIGLPDEVLKNVYHNNAAKLYGLKTV